MSKPGSVLATVAALLILAIGSAAEIDVQLVAVAPGLSADVAISGGAPITIGETIEGVTVLSADRRGAVVRVTVNGVVRG